MEAFCRLCGLHHKIWSMTHLFNEEGSHILQKLNYLNCFTFGIGEDDGFSPYLCNECISLANSAHEFKLLCESVNSVFANMSQMKSWEENASCVVEMNEVTDGGDTVVDSPEAKDYADLLTTPHTFHCDICDRHFSDKSTLIIHMKCHQTLPQTCTKTLKSTVDNSVEKRGVRARKSVCNICNKTFCRARELLRHKKNVHKVVDEDTMKLDEQRIEFICEVCGKVYMTKHALQYHTNGNHVDVIEKKYSCDICGYRCREERNLRQHNRIHTGENPVKCKVKDCDMAFRHHSALNRHNRNVHTKVVPRRFKCDICEKCYETSNKLREHKFAHSNELPYQCPECPRTYRYRCSLRKHIKKRHPGVKTPSIKILRKQCK